MSSRATCGAEAYTQIARQYGCNHSERRATVFARSGRRLVRSNRRARSGRQRHARWRRGRLDAEVATCVGYPTLRASAARTTRAGCIRSRVEPRASGMAQSVGPASEPPLVHRVAYTGRSVTEACVAAGCSGHPRPPSAFHRSSYPPPCTSTNPVTERTTSR